MSQDLLRTSCIELIESLVADKVITGTDLARFALNDKDKANPEYVRQEMERWYRTLGIEYITQQPFNLSLPPYTSEELREAYIHNEIIICVPKGITRSQLGALLRVDCWALNDGLVSEGKEVEDFWFTTQLSDIPAGLNKTAVQTREELERAGKLGMTLNRYMVFVARMRHETGKTPDLGYWVWLTRSQYDQRGILVAGFDSKAKFSVHGWLPSFQGARCGYRFVTHPDHL